MPSHRDKQVVVAQSASAPDVVVVSPHQYANDTHCEMPVVHWRHLSRFPVLYRQVQCHESE